VTYTDHPTLPGAGAALTGVASTSYDARAASPHAISATATLIANATKVAVDTSNTRSR